ncbi:protein phosphatase 1 regulatory subunit 37-like [Ptychodera flava]|uniref:protein phosphatase 1 regulatory subunit 37-like n=1 Tax=Ptychodera flava TaxID=63121 RepID=UPI00396A169D
MEPEIVDSATEVTEDSPKNESKPNIKLPGRRVNFPDDDELVSGKVDPLDPWSAARDTSTEELVDSYKDSCVKWNVKPIPRLLQQLYAINDFTTKTDLLNLKGERLDVRQCEALEDVFKRVQFKTIDLENANLEDESVTALCDMFEYYESTEKLILASNRNIGPRGWQAAARYIKKTDSLECLDLRNCSVTELSMPVLARSLRFGSTVTALHLENCNLAGRPMFVLTSSLKFNQTIKDLFLADNRLMPSDAIQVATMLKFNWTLKLLDLRNNHIQNVGVAHLCDGLVEQKEDGLSTLVLWNNGISHVAMNELGRALGECQHLDTLNLGHNTLTNEGVLVLKDGLLRNTSILRLGLVNTKITCEGAIALAEYLADSSRILRIDIRENDIRTGGLMALTLSLKVNRSLLRLDIEIKKEAELEEIQKSLQEEMSNYCKRNREIAKDENFKRQVIEAQRAVERKTLHRSHEDISPNQDGKSMVETAAENIPTVSDAGNEKKHEDGEAATGDVTKEGVSSHDNDGKTTPTQDVASEQTIQEPNTSVSKAGALA